MTTANANENENRVNTPRLLDVSLSGIAHPPTVKSFQNRSFLHLLLRPVTAIDPSKRNDALACNKQNKNERVPLKIPGKRPTMDGGVTPETQWCQAKSASLREKCPSKRADFVYAAT
jgi:hypothetical protein